MENKCLILITLYLLSINVNAQYQTLCPNELVRVSINIDYGDFIKPCSDCVCSIDIKNQKGDIIDSITPSYEGSGIFSFTATIPPYEVGDEYKAFTVCTSAEHGDISLIHTFILIDCSIRSSDGLTYDDSTIPELGLVDKILNGIKSFIPESISGFSDKILKTVKIDSLSKLGEMGAEVLDIIAEMKDGITKGSSYMKSFVLNPTGFLFKLALPALKSLLLTIINAFFLIFIFLEIYIILRSFEHAKDIFDLLWHIAKINIDIIKTIIDYTLNIINLMIKITDSIINLVGSVINAITNLVPF